MPDRSRDAGVDDDAGGCDGEGSGRARQAGLITPITPPPVVEAKPTGDVPDLTLRVLHQRIRQQQILAELGVTALARRILRSIVDRYRAIGGRRSARR